MLNSFNRAFFMRFIRPPCFLIPIKILADFIKSWSLICCFACSEYFCRHCWVKHILWNMAWFAWYPKYDKITIALFIVKFCLKSRVLCLDFWILRSYLFINLVFFFEFQLSLIIIPDIFLKILIIHGNEIIWMYDKAIRLL